MKKIFLGFIVGLFVFCYYSAFSQTIGSWVKVGSMNTMRLGHAMALLGNGQAMAIGGYNNAFLSSVELFNPNTNTWEFTGALNSARTSHTATVLLDGRVLVVGGLSDTGYLSTAEIYDPSTSMWTFTGPMNIARAAHSATLLPNGQVLVAGGHNSNSGTLSSAEIYDPSSGTWSVTGSMSVAREWHVSTLLQNNLVLVSGAGNTAELYNATASTWNTTGTMNNARSHHTVTLLPNGQVLAAGGYNGVYCLSAAELYTPNTGTWANTGNMNDGRCWHQASLLPSGQVLVVGGEQSSFAVMNSGEIYNPTKGTWAITGTLNNARYCHTATLLSNGNALVSGGTNGTALASTEEYNNIPTVNSFAKSSYENVNVTFTPSDFVNNFNSIVGTGLVKIKILSLPANGTLKLAEAIVTVGEEIAVSDLGKLIFVPTTGWIGITNFGWNGSDGSLYATNQANIGITINNEPPVLTDMTKSLSKNNIFQFAASDFTNNFSGCCSKGLSKVMITSLPKDGVLKMLDTVVVVNQEIDVGYLKGLTYTPISGYVGSDSFSWNGSDGTVYAISPVSVSINIKDKDDPATDWIKTPQGIATVVCSIVGGVSSAVGAIYTINKCRHDKTFCFKKKKPSGGLSLPLMGEGDNDATQ